MSPSMNLRVVVAGVSFETTMVIKPIQYHRADKVYLLHYAKQASYDAFLKEVERQVGQLVKECECVKVNINNFKEVDRWI